MLKRFLLNLLGNGGHKKNGFKFSMKKQLLLMASLIAFLCPPILLLIMPPFDSGQYLDIGKSILIYYGSLAPAMAALYAAGKKIENGN